MSRLRRARSGENAVEGAARTFLFQASTGTATATSGGAEIASAPTSGRVASSISGRAPPLRSGGARRRWYSSASISMRTLAWTAANPTRACSSSTIWGQSGETSASLPATGSRLPRFEKRSPRARSCAQTAIARGRHPETDRGGAGPRRSSAKVRPCRAAPKPAHTFVTSCSILRVPTAGSQISSCSNSTILDPSELTSVISSARVMERRESRPRSIVARCGARTATAVAPEQSVRGKLARLAR